MRPMLLTVVALSSLLSACQGMLSQQNPSAFRSSDATLVQLCFDGLDNTAPKTLRASEIGDISTSSKHFELVGFTTTHRPIYQAAFGHPTRVRAVLVDLPGTKANAILRMPSDLHTHIDVWKTVPVESCTLDERAAFAMAQGGKVNPVECPKLGLDASIKIAASAEHMLKMVNMISTGPTLFNGLRGCREPVYGPK